MSPSDQTPLANLINVFVNFNLNVVFNLFFYSASTTFGVLIASKAVEEFVRHLRFKSDTNYKSRHDEILELNKKMHDRLVEAELAIKNNKSLSTELVKRLLLNSSRLIKYDKSIIIDTNRLINLWTTTLTLHDRKYFSDGDLSKERGEVINICSNIILKIDKIKV